MSGGVSSLCRAQAYSQFQPLLSTQSYLQSVRVCHSRLAAVYVILVSLQPACHCLGHVLCGYVYVHVYVVDIRHTVCIHVLYSSTNMYSVCHDSHGSVAVSHWL